MTTPYLRIMPLNLWDSATLTSSAAPATDFPLTNTQNSIRSLVTRSPSGAAWSISASWPASVSGTFFGMFLHTAGGGNVRWQLFSDAAWTTPATPFADSTALAANNITPTEPYDWGNGSNDPFAGQWPFWLWYSATTFRSARVSFSGTPTAGYFQASRIWAAKAFEVTYEVAQGATLGWVDKTDRNRSRGGSLRTNVGPSWRVMTMELNRIAEAQRATWLDIMRYCGTGRDVVLSLFPEDGTRRERDHLVNAKFSALDAIGRDATRLTKKLQVEEV